MKESNLQVLRIVPADQTGPETAEEGGGEMKADPTKADVKVCLFVCPSLPLAHISYQLPSYFF